MRIDTKLKRSISFHPQIDGKIEVVNKTVVQLLRRYCSKHPKNWDEYTIYIQHSYNRAIHASTNRTPFETCFGYLPSSPFDCTFGQQDDHDQTVPKEEEQVEKFIEKIQHVHMKVQEHLKTSHACTFKTSHAKYKLRHDQHRVEHKFHVGDKVQLYHSKERLQGQAKKLKPLQYGPFDNIEKLNDNASRLNLLAYMQIYLIVKVNSLKFFEPTMITEEEEIDTLYYPSITYLHVL